MIKTNLLIISIFLFIYQCNGHGMMLIPTARNSLWRFIKSMPINYDDNALNCGGLYNQWWQNDGKCGPCGDDYGLPQPRTNENTGTFGLGYISKEYKAGEIINITIRITANHLGFFKFSLCQLDNNTAVETDECFKQLKLADGQPFFHITKNELRDYFVQLKLPEDIECERCVLQWTYTGGNNWGMCADGTGRLGCGPQETFKNCADITIKKLVDGSFSDTIVCNDSDCEKYLLNIDNM